MSLTLGFFISVCLILPGLLAVASFNQKAGRAGVRRPEQPLTSISTLVAAISLSIIAHFWGYLLSDWIIALARSINTAFPQVDLGTAVPNPIRAAYVSLATGRPINPDVAIALSAVFVLEIFAVMAFVSRDPFDLLVEPLDLGGHGWVFQHVTRPAENGYTPIATVFTSATSDGYGIAYKGPVVDIRQGNDGNILSVALSRPERFVYQLGTKPPVAPVFGWRPKRTSATSLGTGFAVFEKESIGGVVGIDGSKISNFNVQNVSNEIIRLLDQEGKGEEDA